VREYRDRIYMRKDVLLKLYQYGELNQTKLMSFCGLNSVKHRGILEDMVGKGLITRRQEHWGDTIVLMYKASEKGMKILRELLEPYEELFPRGSEHGKNGEVSDGSRI
jgi:predicted transcriptional regulator